MRPPIIIIRLGLGFLLISTAFNCISKPEASPAYPFWDPDLTVEERVEDVISRLSLEEKVAQLYVSDPGASVPVPIRSLQGFQRVYLDPGQRKTVSFGLEPHQLSLINRNGERMIEAGRYSISIGGKQPGFSGSADAATTGVVSGSIEMKANKILSPSPAIPEN